MANKSDRVAGSVNGAFYVDSSCIGCGMCVETASENFSMNKAGDLAMVFKQPENEEEYQACEGARNACPAEAIGDDGE